MTANDVSATELPFRPAAMLDTRCVVQDVAREFVKSGGLGNLEWPVGINRDGIVCSIATSGTMRSDGWPEIRVLAASKVNTANGAITKSILSERMFVLGHAALVGLDSRRELSMALHHVRRERMRRLNN